MKCPTCPDSKLTLAERQGIEIDYCPSCRGVWLDRGELDKLIERAAEAQAPRADRYDDRDDRDDRRNREKPGKYEKYDKDDDDRGLFGRKKKKESFLSELFEFGG